MTALPSERGATLSLGRMAKLETYLTTGPLPNRNDTGSLKFVSSDKAILTATEVIRSNETNWQEITNGSRHV